MKKVFFNSIIILFTYINTYSQQSFYSEVLYGGVSGTGFGVFNNSSVTKSVVIPPNSTIKKAYLLAERLREAPDIKVKLNNNYYWFTSETSISQKFIGNNAPPCIGYKSTVNAIDITKDINVNILNYTLQVPLQQNGCTNGEYIGFYLYIVFENFNMLKTACNLSINNQDVNDYNSYNLNELMPIDNNNDVGLGINTFFFCDTVIDGSFISVNNTNIGLVGGNDPLEQMCSGVYSNFAYYNNSLQGIASSTPNNTMSGTDALSDIKSYVNYLDVSVNVSFSYQSPTWTSGKRTNPVISLMLSYATPCDTFSVSVTPDTTICIGNQLQLQATGGQTYKWSTNGSTSGNGQVEGLSCSDCPNPVFSGNRTMNYSVRVWNNDSCSIVRPIRVQVNNPQKVNCYASETQCGISDGFISAPNLPADIDKWYVVTPTNDTLYQPISNTFSNLGAGNYNVYYIDTMGCKSVDTMVVIETNHNTVADFTVSPESGMAPLTVEITNQSQFASNYTWFINGVPSSSIPNITFDSTGVYEIGLIAWKLDEACGDTTWKTVVVFDSLIVHIPNVFTPSGDGVNEFFGIKVSYPVEAHLVILNRWGNDVFQWKGTLQEGENNLWNGKSKEGNQVIDGVYFYRIELSNLKGTEKERKLAGYVHLIGN